MKSNKYLLDINDFENLRDLNRGVYWVVHLVQHKKTQALYASKLNMYKLDDSDDHNKLFVFCKLLMLMEVNHPIIAQIQSYFFWDFSNNKNITIFMEYLSLRSFVSMIELEDKNGLPIQNDNTKKTNDIS